MRFSLHARTIASLFVACFLSRTLVAADVPTPEPVVEAEEEVYRYTPADNGAGPLWCHGSTCLVRSGEQLFASGIETIPDAVPLNNVRWMLFARSPSGGWQLRCKDEKECTREPCPLAAFPAGRVFLSANPTLAPAGAHSGPARPEILAWTPGDIEGGFSVLRPEWSGEPPFTEHSYRSFAADGPNRELILLQNVDYTHAEWAFLDRDGAWSASGKLAWPEGQDYPEPEPIRICYPTVELRDRSVFFCGVSDIIEPYPAWRAFKKKLTGRDWDYDFRRLFFTWCDDIRTGEFHSWVEISSRDKTAGGIFPCDLWAAPDGTVHLLWSERAIDERLRADFFPEVRQRHSLEYAVVRDGQVVLRKAIAARDEGEPGELPGRGRFQVTADQRLFVLYDVQGSSASGQRVTENRVVEIARDGTVSASATVPLRSPMTSFFTATHRAGSPPSEICEILGEGVEPMSVRYARIRLLPAAYRGQKAEGTPARSP